jgi:hypothetical protein
VAEDSWVSPDHSSGSVSDQEYEQLVQAAAASGIIGSPGDTSVAFGDASGMNVKIRADKHATVRGFHWASGGSTLTLSVGSNGAGSTRIDLLVLRLSRSTWNVRAAVVAGVAGNPAPTPTQDTGTSGVWELPIATISVAPGASSIAANKVTPVNWYIGPPTIVCTSTTRPPAAAGQRIFETDTGKEFVGNGSSFVTSIIDSGWVNVPAIAGWTSACKVRNLNGQITVNGAFTRTGSSIAANSQWQMGTLPSAYWPSGPANIRVPMVRSGGIAIAGWIGVGTGIVVIQEFAAAISSGQVVYLSTSYPLG